MYDFKPGDKVQMDPALVNGGLRVRRGVGVVQATRAAGTSTLMLWPERRKQPTKPWKPERRIYKNSVPTQWVRTRDLVPVADTREVE